MATVDNVRNSLQGSRPGDDDPENFKLSGDLRYLTDGKRHLVCIPYNRENLFRMAKELGIKECWFHRDHFDIPKRRIQEIEAVCEMVSSKDIVNIIKGRRKS